MEEGKKILKTDLRDMERKRKTTPYSPATQKQPLSKDAARKITSELYTTEDVVRVLQRIERLLEKLIRFEEKKETF